jgi:hypothetical protein
MGVFEYKKGQFNLIDNKAAKPAHDETALLITHFSYMFGGPNRVIIDSLP